MIVKITWAAMSIFLFAITIQLILWGISLFSYLSVGLILFISTLLFLIVVLDVMIIRYVVRLWRE